MPPAIDRTSTLPEKIGRYRVTRELGRGGMGVVYLARDPNLLRQVAIKVLPDAVARDPEWSARFEQEAQVLASLDHPNIAVVHSLERTEDGSLYLVMEYIEGESLSERITRQRLSTTDALTICRRVARALEAAHDRGVVHRDLKPANIMLGLEGQVKVLDFGLAIRLERGCSEKTTAEHASGGAPADLLSDATVLIEPSPSGIITGTPGYVSPEQARSESCDHRTDFFAFGCVLYECLTGTRAFLAGTWLETVASVLRDDPDWTRLPAGLPEPARAVLLSCLAKSPDQRPSHAREIRKALEQTNPVSPSGPNGSPRHNLPRDLSSFIGRDEELARVIEALRSTSLVTLAGAGGSGKTRLAVKAGSELLGEYPDGVWLVGMASVTDPSLVPSTIAAALGLRESGGKSAQESLGEWLRSKRVLLILDNCEHLVSACAETAQRLLQDCPNLKILATSREVLGVSGESSLRVPSMSLPPQEHEAGLADLDQWEACRLFLERARAASSGFAVSATAAPVIGRICRRLDGIPLAIELAAARVRVLSVEQIEDRLHDCFRFLTGGSRTALERHQTLRAALDWSYGLLSEEEQCWLRTLAVFSGGWTLEAAGSVGGDGLDEIEVMDALTHLVDKSLVIADGSSGEPRYRMLEMVRQYARDKWNQPSEGTALRHRHLDYCVDLLGRAREHFHGGPEQKAWFDRVETEHENCQAALQWSESIDEGAEKGLRIVTLLGQFWYVRGYGLLARKSLQQALDHDMKVEGRSDDRDAWRASALNAAAHFLNDEGRYAEARPLVEEAIAIRRRLGSAPDLARHLLTLGTNRLRAGNLPEARKAQEEALEIARSAGSVDLTAFALNALAAVLYSMAEFDECRRYLEESLAMRREQQNLPDVAMVLGNLGGVLALQGDSAGARRYLEEALALQRDLRNPTGMVNVLENLGGLLLDLGETEQARHHYEEALEITLRLGQKPNTALLLSSISFLEARQGSTGPAATSLREAIRLCGSLSAAPELASCFFGVACLATKTGDFVAAARFFGFADGLTTGNHHVPLKGTTAFVDESRQVVRGALGDDGFFVALEDGRSRSWEEGTAEAGRFLDALLNT